MPSGHSLSKNGALRFRITLARHRLAIPRKLHLSKPVTIRHLLHQYLLLSTVIASLVGLFLLCDPRFGGIWGCIHIAPTWVLAIVIASLIPIISIASISAYNFARRLRLIPTYINGEYVYYRII